MKFSGGVYSAELPGHHFTVALLDECGTEVLRVTANEPTERAEIPTGHGFSIPIPSDWLVLPTPRHFQFRIVESGELFPRVPREIPIGRVLKKLGAKSRTLHEGMRQQCESLLQVVGRDALVVGTHALTRTGAPLIVLEIVKQLRRRFGREVVLLSLGPKDVLYEEFQSYCSLIVCDLEESFRFAPEQTAGFFSLLSRRTRCRVALINSLVSTKLAAACHSAGFEVKTLIHEYAQSFPPERIAALLGVCSDLVFPCRDVAEDFFAKLDLAKGSKGAAFSILPQGCYMLEKENPDPGASYSFASSFRQKHELTRSEKVVAFCGSIESRKGFDWMATLIHKYAETSPNAPRTRFLWIGAIVDRDLYFHSIHDLQQKGLGERLVHLDEQTDVRLALTLADVFFLCSRLDPFPSVVLEAILLGKPVIGFDKSQGCRDMLRETGFGRIVPYQCLEASSLAIDETLSDHGMLQRVKSDGPAYIKSAFSFPDYVEAVHGWLFEGRLLPKARERSKASVSSMEPV